MRVDSGTAEGSEVSVYYDPMIAKVIATAETRALAIARLTTALREVRDRRHQDEPDVPDSGPGVRGVP